jgi:hypothetical protein
MCQYWLAGDPVLQVVKSFLALLGPYPFSIFSCEFIEWMCNVCKTSNERPVKIAKAQKRSDILNFGGHRPIFYACNFYGVHACYPLFKDYPS